MGAERLPVVHHQAVIIDSAARSAAELERAVGAFLIRYPNDRTREGYARSLKQWFAWCHEHFRDPLHVTRMDVEGFQREQERRGLAPSTVGQKLNAIVGFYRLALIDEAIDKDPTVHLIRPKIPRESSTLGLSRAEVTSIVSAAKRASRQDYALIAILVFNGVRISEALGIDLVHLDHASYEGQTTVLITRKGGRRQHILLAPRTGWAVQRLLEERGDRGPLFLSRTGRRLDRHGAARVVERIAKAAGIGKHVHPHMFRHAFVTLSRDAGISDRRIMNDTGHADGRMIEYYDRSKHKLSNTATVAYSEFIGAGE